MNPKKFSQIVEKAKKTYTDAPKTFNPYLENKTQVLPLNFVVGKRIVNSAVNSSQMNLNQNPQYLTSTDLGNNSNAGNESENLNFNNNSSVNSQGHYIPQNYSTAQNYSPQTMPYTGPQINVVGGGGNFGGAINIIAKNYINPDSLEDSSQSQMERDLPETKSKTLAKIPDNLIKSSSTEWEPINYMGVNVSYDLYELAKVEIKFDEAEQKLIYKIIEPELDEYELETLEELKKGFIYVFEKFSRESHGKKEKELIFDGTKKLCSKYKIKLTEEQMKKITYYLERDFLGLEIIEPIMHDPFIEDVSCDGLNIPVFVNHLKYGPLETNRSYNDPLKLNSFIVKLAQKSNQEVSLSKPILQGALPEGSRVEAIYGKEISEKGSSYTIRKFRAEPMTPIHLIEFGTMPAFLLAYLWLAVENKQSLLVSGGTATGKTTILNALSLFVPPTSKIVSIEDTPEINLPHEHWLPMIARESEGKAEVSMFDLLKASLRERPDYIIVGEIRGAEAAILFQGMATGHAGLGTVHADKFEDLVNRMTIAPINLPKQLLTELNIVIFMKHVKVKTNMVRRVSSVVEIIEYNNKQDKFYTNEFVKFLPSEDKFEFKEKSAIISQLIELRGGKEESVWTEIEKRRRILDFMHTNKILEFKAVSDVIKAYYKDPAEIFNYIEKNLKKISDVKNNK